MSSYEPALDAIRRGDAAAVDRLLAEHPDAASAPPPAGGAPSLVLQALYHRRLEIAERLAAARGALDLHEAAALGNAERVGELVAERPDAARDRSPDGFTALHLAAFFGRAKVVRRLLEAGAEADAVAENPTRVTPLHSAVAGGDAEAVDHLLAAGATVDARQQQGFTPLMGAAANGREDILRRLLAAGADPALADDTGKTAADHARGHGHEELVGLLG